MSYRVLRPSWRLLEDADHVSRERRITDRSRHGQRRCPTTVGEVEVRLSNICSRGARPIRPTSASVVRAATDRHVGGGTAQVNDQGRARSDYICLLNHLVTGHRGTRSGWSSDCDDHTETRSANCRRGKNSCYFLGKPHRCLLRPEQGALRRSKYPSKRHLGDNFVG